MKRYVVTAKAGDWVAGQRATHGAVLTLTDAQAEYELARGLIRPASASVAAADAAAATSKSRRRRGA